MTAAPSKPYLPKGTRVSPATHPFTFILTLRGPYEALSSFNTDLSKGLGNPYVYLPKLVRNHQADAHDSVLESWAFLNGLVASVPKSNLVLRGREPITVIDEDVHQLRARFTCVHLPTYDIGALSKRLSDVTFYCHVQLHSPDRQLMANAEAVCENGRWTSQLIQYDPCSSM
jgi:hypothetical protein